MRGCGPTLTVRVLTHYELARYTNISQEKGGLLS